MRSQMALCQSTCRIMVPSWDKEKESERDDNRLAIATSSRKGQLELWEINQSQIATDRSKSRPQKLIKIAFRELSVKFTRPSQPFQDLSTSKALLALWTRWCPTLHSWWNFQALVTFGDCWWLVSEHVESGGIRWNPVDQWKHLEDTAEAGALDLEDTAGSPGHQSAGQTWRSPCACQDDSDSSLIQCFLAVWKAKQAYLILLDLTCIHLYILVYTCIYLYILVSLLRAFCSNHCLGAPGEVSPKTLARPCTDVSFFCSWMSRILVSPSLPWRLTPHHHHQVCCQIGPRTGPSPVTSKRDKQVQHFQENKNKRQ